MTANNFLQAVAVAVVAGFVADYIRKQLSKAA